MKVGTVPPQDVEKLKANLRNIPEPVVHPALIVVSGLPGTGKSFFCRKLAEQAPLLIIESDALRQVLFPNPTHTAEESARLFAALHALVRYFLSKSVSIVVDATNLVERHREILYNIAEQQGARLVLVWVEAPAETVRQRLVAREKALDCQDHDKSGQADWSVYQKMKPTVEKIRRPHFVLDTSRDITPVIQKVLRQITRR